MLDALLTVFVPMLLGTQLILTLILLKGDICPGQRGRIHKVLPAIGVLWLTVTLHHIEAFLVVATIFYFFSQVQTKKTRDQGPMWLLYGANIFASIIMLMQAFEQNSLAGGITYCLFILFLGSGFTHLLLTIARTRLQAFHHILPLAALVSGMFIVLSIIFHTYTLSDDTLSAMTPALLMGFALLVTTIVISCWHLFTQKSAEKIQLFISVAVGLMAATYFQMVLSVF
ncbi:hypothetical protein BCU68_00895 [Vibrio sp. 10N.286.49.B3]|uniref:hypothetical protein n=1 Tax=Vibrio sp. 10N.286.49.B3 TaxID=1880855 RepID=UPI000C821C07|nr:hypothetical protein [Vibrio sp. 10N.286.49.B3]PMH46627.1 hypothetical protein BCU68_00895 [Vibrio sp. 10N.286.49.B3]